MDETIVSPTWIVSQFSSIGNKRSALLLLLTAAGLFADVRLAVARRSRSTQLTARQAAIAIVVELVKALTKQ